MIETPTAILETLPKDAALPQDQTKPIDVLNHYRAHDHSLYGLLTSRAAARPDQPFLLFQGHTCTFGEAVTRVDAIAHNLAARGIRKGDRVGIMSTNSDAYVLFMIALARIGGIVVPVNPELNTAEAGYILTHAGVAAIACAGASMAVARAAAGALPITPWFITLDGHDDTAVPFQALLREPDATSPPAATADDIWLTLYTSGTTGFPKGVMHSQRNFVIAGEAFVERMYLQPDDRLLVVLPLFHINALFYSLGGALAAGASLLLVPRFSASNFWKAAAEGGATEVNIIGAIGNILKKRPRTEFVAGHTLRKIYGAGMSAEILDIFPREFQVPILVEGYGLTEVPGVCNNPFHGPRKIGSIGPPARHPDHRRPFSEMRILDDDGKELPIGETGEIAVRTPITMQGYYREPEATAATFRDGWFLTGDLGYRDADGYYYFIARKKDIIRRRGENISGAEIDRVVGSHPKVLEAAAIAVPGELGDDEILLVTVARPGCEVAPEEIAEWCAQKLAPWKMPRYFVQADSLPHTPTHRVAKFKLKQDPSIRQRAVELRSPR